MMKEKLANCYYEKLLLFAAMEYCSIEEEATEESLYRRIIQQAIDSLLSGENSGVQKAQEELALAREELLERTDLLTAYVDKLSVYQYALNRVELRFAEKIEEPEINAFLQEVLNYIFASKDNMIINEAIKDILGQLPVRMTKEKYFERLSDSLSIYKGADKAALDSLLYVLQTCSMTYQAKGEQKYYHEYKEVVAQFAEVDFKNITQEEHKRLEGMLEEASEGLMAETDTCILWTELINHLYGACLLWRLIAKEERMPEAIEALLQAVKHKDFVQAEKVLTTLEGRPEKLIEKEGKLESVLFEKNPEEDGIKELLMAQALGSDSLFMEFKEEENCVVEEKMLLEETTKLENELRKLFSKNSMLINRAIMANTLSKLPVFFQSSQEVADYIKNALEQCRDEAERVMSMRLILEMIRN